MSEIIWKDVEGYEGLYQVSNTGLVRSFYQAKEGKILTLRNREDTSKKIKCIETGEIYPSISEAARKNGAHFAAISRVCHGQQKTANGLYWEFVR